MASADPDLDDHIKRLKRQMCGAPLDDQEKISRILRNLYQAKEIINPSGGDDFARARQMIAEFARQSEENQKGERDEEEGRAEDPDHEAVDDGGAVPE